MATVGCCCASTSAIEMPDENCRPQIPGRLGGVDSPHKDKDGYFVPWCRVVPSFSELLRWRKEEKRPEWSVVENRSYPPPPLQLSPEAVHVTNIGHSTFLLQMGSVNILTDPVWSEVVGPFGRFGPRRVRPPGLTLAQLPPIHLVVISHNHYDHMDLPSIRSLEEKFSPRFLVPPGNAKIVRSAGARDVVEIDWWESHFFRDEFEVVAVPAQHWSRRGLFDTNDALWSGFAFRGPKMQVLFAGDSGYGPHFSAIKQRLGSFDVSLLPIGAYLPRWFMGPQHMGPDEAMLAHRDLASRVSIAFHHDTFPLASDAFGQAERELVAARREGGLDDDAFVSLDVGQGILCLSGKDAWATRTCHLQW